MTRVGASNTQPPVTATATAPAGGSATDRFLMNAMRFMGQPYRWGGGHGKTMSGPGPVDCSGLVMQAARMAGLNMDGTAASQQRAGKPVAMNQLKPGDLVFRGNPAHHVGIYMGDGKVLHAPKSGDVVKISPVGNFTSARRPAALDGANAATGTPSTAAQPGDAAHLNAGPQTSFGLPPAPIPAGGPVPAYQERFGSQSYVKDAKDPSLLNLARNAVQKAPELGGTALAKAAAGGRLGPAEVKEMQTFLESKGYNVGSTGVDGKYGPKTHRAMAAFLEGKAPDQAPAAPATSTAGTPEDEDQAAVTGTGQVKDGHTIPNNGQGSATVFANGHIPYKGWSDTGNRQNGGIGAWGDKNAPTDYFCALPVGLDGTSGKWWHNQKIMVTNPATGQKVVVRVQDKGPHPRTGNAIDLSPVAMEAIGGSFKGKLGQVKFEFAPDDAPVGPVR